MNTASDIWSLAKRGFASLSIQIVNRIVMLALGVALARGLGVEAYGVYAFALAILGALATFADVGIPQLTVREVARLSTSGDWGALKGHLLAGGQITLLVSILVATAGIFAAPLLSSGVQLEALCAMFLMLPGTLAVRYGCASLRGAGFTTIAQFTEYVLIPVVVLTAVAGVFLADEAWRTPTVAIALQAVIGFAVAVVVLPAAWRMLVKNRSAATVNPPRLSFLQQALPFALIGGVSLLNSQIDLIMLGIFREATDVGLYRVAVLGAMLVAFGLQAGNAVLPTYFARFHTEQDKERLQALLTTSARAILGIAAPVAVVLVTFGGTLAALVFGAGFAASHVPLAILAAGELIGASMGSVGFLLYMTGRENRALKVLGFTAVLNIVLNLLLIPPFGMTGAAVATATGQLVRLVLLYRIVRVELGLDPAPWFGLTGRRV